MKKKNPNIKIMDVTDNLDNPETQETIIGQTLDSLMSIYKTTLSRLMPRETGGFLCESILNIERQILIWGRLPPDRENVLREVVITKGPDNAFTKVKYTIVDKTRGAFAVIDVNQSRIATCDVYLFRYIAGMDGSRQFLLRNYETSIMDLSKVVESFYSIKPDEPTEVFDL